jgi:hypothetical protein
MRHPLPLPQGYWTTAVKEYSEWLAENDDPAAYLSSTGPWFVITDRGRAMWSQHEETEPRLRSIFERN